jgi:hypothetical protein
VKRGWDLVLVLSCFVTVSAQLETVLLAYCQAARNSPYATAASIILEQYQKQKASPRQTPPGLDEIEAITVCDMGSTDLTLL